MKAIIERNLPLNTKYIVTDKKYIPLTESFGCTCDNCNKLIANIATVKNENGKSFNIGFDCLETVLINNSLLSTNDIKEYERVKAMIPKVIRLSKTIKEIIELNNGLDGLLFERPSEFSKEYFTYYLVKGSGKPYNTSAKIKDMDFDFLLTTLKNIFPKLQINEKTN